VVIRLLLVLALGAVVLAPAAAQGASVRFVAAGPALRAACRSTAREVGYPVPCPTRVPANLESVGGRPGCTISIIGAGRQCPNTHGCWCRWVVGSSSDGVQSLVLEASPWPLQSYAKVVNGPAWYPAARIRPRGFVSVGGRRMRVVWVPALTNDASSFSDHVALIWTEAGHTYAIGFQNLDGFGATLELDLELAAGIRLVAP
jgi:hypothetical protein